jgi:plastocyanin
MPMSRPRPLFSLALACSLALALAACGGDDDGGGLAGGAGGTGDDGTAEATGDPDVTLPDEVVDLDGDPAEVRAIDNSFDPVGARVPAGTTVRWTNAGRQDHDVVPVGDPTAAEWGADVEHFHPGDTYEHTFTEPGTYNYYCTIHGTEAKGMVGVVVVE